MDEMSEDEEPRTTELDSFGFTFIPLQPLRKFIATLQGIIDQQPEEVRETVSIEMERGWGDDSGGVIEFTRMETQDEANARALEDARWRANDKRENEARERAQFEALKRKFG